MDLADCAYSTDHLRVEEWHSTGPVGQGCGGLVDVVAGMLSEPVTRSLPPAWQGDYRLDRARDWITERDSEGTTLLAVDSESNDPVGLVILFNGEEDGQKEIRLGYILAERAWGRGLATELVAGLADWCRARGFKGMITAGVAHDNLPSRRVLEKNGFTQDEFDSAGTGDLVYRLHFN